MSLKDLLSAEGRLKFRIQWNTKKLLQRYAQSDARMEAADKLKSIGTPEAIYALARRFSVNSENLGIDNDEKRQVGEVLVDFGEKAVEPLRRYIRNHDGVTWAIDCLKKLEPEEQLVPFLVQQLQRGDPVHIRGEKATQILHALETLHDPRVVEGVIPCLESPDDTVRFAAVDCLEAHADERARDALLEALVSELEDSMRVRTRLAEALERLGWDVKGFRKKVEEALPQPYRLNSKGRIYKLTG
jgi:HEAT repeat protein